MKRYNLLATVIFTSVLFAGCGGTQHIISLQDGTMIEAGSTPKLDAKTGMYVYKDKEGRQHQLKKEEVKQIIER